MNEPHWQIRSVVAQGGTTELLERGRAVPFRSPLGIGPRLAAFVPSADPGFAPISHFNDVEKYELRDVVLEGSFHLMRKGPAFVAESLYGIGDMRLKRSLIELLEHVDVCDEATYVVGYNWTSVNFYHWMIQALPSIHACFLSGGDTSSYKLVLPALNSWQEQSLALLGYGEVDRLVLARDCRAFLPRVLFTNLLTGNGRASRMVQMTLHHLKLAARVSSGPRRRIYVSRRDADYRLTINEDEVADEMRRRGFEAVAPGTFSVCEQIEIFHNASVVVGPHGAGMANIGFCTPGTMFYEMMPLDHVDPCMAHLAQLMGVKYASDGFDQPGTEWGGHRNMFVDMDRLRSRLDHIAPRVSLLGWRLPALFQTRRLLRFLSPSSAPV